MFSVVPLEKEHLIELSAEPENAFLVGSLADGFYENDASRGFSRTAFLNGKIAVCAGINELWPNRGFLWSIFSKSCESNFLPVFRGIKKFLAEAPFKRIEMGVPCEFERGHRRALMLGFTLECSVARAFLSSGQDCSTYALVKKGGN
jgi:hypothetical protein